MKLFTVYESPLALISRRVSAYTSLSLYECPLHLIMRLFHRVMMKCQSLEVKFSSIERMAHLSNEHLHFDALLVKVLRTLISPELV
jgi:hypothetical protein